MYRKYKYIKGILLRLSGDYPDSLQILSADRSIIREAYPAYPPQLWLYISARAAEKSIRPFLEYQQLFFKESHYKNRPLTYR